MAAFLACPANVVAQAEGSRPDRTQRVKYLNDAKRILFLGDSITAAGGYVVDFETWHVKRRDPGQLPVLNMGLASETVSGLSEEGHAGGQFPRPDLFERLERMLDTAKPDLVFACYGMNCGIYQPFDEDRFEKYRVGITLLKKTVEKDGAKLILITPPFYDSLKHSDKDFYDGVLSKYTDWLNERAAKDGWLVIDLHTAMAHEVAERRKTDPKFTFAGDGVHPNADGHWFIATRIFQWFGDDDSANAKTPQEMMKLWSVPNDVRTAVAARSATLRDAYVAAAGHKRPGVAKGLPIPEAEAKVAPQTKLIRDKLGVEAM
ncbi:MAG: SGNH/GDSL hydrolase family protein [Pirellulales bacterium]